MTPFSFDRRTSLRARVLRTALGASCSLLCAGHAFAQAAEPPPADAPAEPPAEPAPAPPGAEAPPPEAPPAPEAAPAEAAAAEPAPVEAPKPKPPPYSLPFQLRPVVAGNVIRSDTAIGFYENAKSGNSGSTIASMLLFSYKVAEGLAPLLRLGVVSNSPPDTKPPSPPAESGFAFLNPVVGATYALQPAKPLRVGLFLGLAAPIGSGGGNSPEAKTRAALASGILTRSAMDNAMFAVNYFTVFPGVGVAFVEGGFTAQAEATLLQLTRVRGDKVDTDTSRTNFTAGLHVGYFLIPQLSLGAELRHQRWLSTPNSIKADDALRDNTTVAFGPRFHIQLQDKMWLRPGVSVALPLDNPMRDNATGNTKYKIVQIDVPFAF